jgi:predicted RNase H-like HicB family nuclease
VKFTCFAVLEYTPEDELDDTEAVGVYFPDISGCVSCGDNTEHALKRAKEALSIHLSGEDLNKLPKQSSKDVLEKNLRSNEKLFEITVPL